MGNNLHILKRLARNKLNEDAILPEDFIPLVEQPVMLSEAATPATLKAKTMGLTYYGFDRWGKEGKATHVQNRDRTDLFPLKRAKKVVVPDKALHARNVQYGLERKARADDHEEERDEYTAQVDTAMRAMFQSDRWIADGKPDAHFAPLAHYDLKKLVEDSRLQFQKLNSDERWAVRSYTSSDYTAINRNLRQMAAVVKGDKSKLPFIDVVQRGSKLGEQILNMSTAFKHFKLAQEVITYRGVDAAEVRDLKEGDLFDVQQYISTSINPRRALNYASSPNMIVIRVPKGTHGVFVAGISSFATENELLLDRGLQLRVRRIEKKLRKDVKNDIIYHLKNQYPRVEINKESIAAYAEKYDLYSKRYIMEIVGRKKLISEDDLANPNHFFNRHRPDDVPERKGGKSEPDWDDDNAIIKNFGNSEKDDEPYPFDKGVMAK